MESVGGRAEKVEKCGEIERAGVGAGSRYMGRVSSGRGAKMEGAQGWWREEGVGRQRGGVLEWQLRQPRCIVCASFCSFPVLVFGGN